MRLKTRQLMLPVAIQSHWVIKIRTDNRPFPNNQTNISFFEAKQNFKEKTQLSCQLENYSKQTLKQINRRNINRRFNKR